MNNPYIVVTMSSACRERLGGQVSAWVDDKGMASTRGAIMVAEWDIPDDISDALTDNFGPPKTIDRGEIAYWIIDGDDVSVEE